MTRLAWPIATLDDVLIARNPATGAELGRVPATPAGRGRRRSSRGPARRRRPGARPPGASAGPSLRRWWRVLAPRRRRLGRRDPRRGRQAAGEAMAGEVVATLDAIRWTVRHGGRALADERIGPGWQRLPADPGGAAALPAGRRGRDDRDLELPAVPQRPADRPGAGGGQRGRLEAVGAGAALRADGSSESLEEAGLPRRAGRGRLRRARGRPGAGRVGDRQGDVHRRDRERPARPRRRWRAGASRRWPSSPGSTRRSSCPTPRSRRRSGALTWAAFVGAGQTCVAVKRVYVVGDPAPWAEALAAAAPGAPGGRPGAPARSTSAR